MRPIRVFFSTLFIMLACQSPTGKSHAYERIVSLKPNITEILFALGAGPQVAGVTQYCDEPAQAKALPKVADYVHIFSEKLLTLRPDLILGSQENGSVQEGQFLLDRGLPLFILGDPQHTSPTETRLLTQRGVAVANLGFATLAETMRSIDALGKLLSREAESASLLTQMRQRLNDLRQKSQNVKKQRAIFVLGYNPLVVAGSGNFFDEAASYLGLINAAGQSRLGYPHYSAEMLIKAAPEIILEFSMEAPDHFARSRDREAFWAKFSSLPAVRNHKVYAFDIRDMRASHRLPQTLQTIFTAIHTP